MPPYPILSSESLLFLDLTVMPFKTPPLCLSSTPLLLLPSLSSLAKTPLRFMGFYRPTPTHTLPPSQHCLIHASLSASSSLRLLSPSLLWLSLSLYLPLRPLPWIYPRDASTRKVATPHPLVCLSSTDNTTPTLAPVEIHLPSRSFTISKAEWSYANLTGHFPVGSYGLEYVLVVVHHGYIHLTPLKNRTSFLFLRLRFSVRP